MAGDRLTTARKAYEKGDLAAAKQAHTTEAVAKEAKEEHSHASGRYISDMVYGASDGIVTTFAVERSPFSYAFRAFVSLSPAMSGSRRSAHKNFAVRSDE